MKKLFRLFIFICLSSSFLLQASVADLIESMQKELKSMNYEAATSDNTVETRMIRFEKAPDGSDMHIGIWPNCVIGTIVDGNPSLIGHQIIMLPDGSIVDLSNDYAKKKNYFVNKYSWGKVSSWDNKQEVQAKVNFILK